MKHFVEMKHFGETIMRPIKRPRYRYWCDWDFIASGRLGRLFIWGLNILWISLIVYWIIELSVGYAQGKYPTDFILK